MDTALNACQMEILNRTKGAIERMYRMIRRWLSVQSGKPLLAAGAALLLLTLIPLKLIVILLALGLLSAGLCASGKNGK